MNTLSVMAYAASAALALASCGDSGDGSGGATGGVSGGAGSGGSSTGGSSTGGSSTGGSSTGGSSTGGAGGADAGADATADAAECAALKSEMEKKLAEAQSCYAGTPNPSACDIVQDAICNCVALQMGYASAYLQAAKAYGAAGCPYTCSAAPCPTTAVCKAGAGSTQGICTPS